MPPKNIVFCADGTWNGPNQDENKDGRPDPTNVLKLYRLLKGDSRMGSRAEEQEQSDAATGQVSKYLHGVGDEDNWLARLAGGAMGAGLIGRIVRGYTFVSRHYVPGDSIYLVGFSRGAYTARALAGMISKMGLLQPGLSGEEAYKAGLSTWREFRGKREGMTESIALWFQGGFNLPDSVKRREVDEKSMVVGVWDTVGAMGIPVYHNDENVDRYKFADNNLSDKARAGFHAIAVDERREAFSPSLWSADPRRRVTQVLFPGAHSDVGGGYPDCDRECDLANIGLAWMIKALRTQGLHVADPPVARKPFNPLGPSHRPWMSAPFDIMPWGDRHFEPKDGLKIHQSVLDRWDSSYQPRALLNKLIGNDPTGEPVPIDPEMIEPY